MTQSWFYTTHVPRHLADSWIKAETSPTSTAKECRQKLRNNLHDDDPKPREMIKLQAGGSVCAAPSGEQPASFRSAWPPVRTCIELLAIICSPRHRGERQGQEGGARKRAREGGCKRTVKTIPPSRPSEMPNKPTLVVGLLKKIRPMSAIGILFRAPTIEYVEPCTPIHVRLNHVRKTAVIHVLKDARVWAPMHACWCRCEDANPRHNRTQKKRDRL